MIPIHAIELLENFEGYRDSTEEKLPFLEPLSKINIFVGANNSGKSRCMRLLSSQEDYNILPVDIDLEDYNQRIKTIINNIESDMELHGLTRANELDVAALNTIRRSLPTLLAMGKDQYQTIRNTFNKWKTFPQITQSMGKHAGNNTENFRKKLQEHAQEALSVLQSIPEHTSANLPQRVYIPTLRGLRALEPVNADVYARQTIADYFPENPPDLFTGLSFFQRLTDMLLGDNRERRAIADYQNFISHALFGGQPITLIPRQHERVVVVKIGTEQEQPIHHMGDGIQSAIILSFLPYVTQEPTFFFIEEPELYLHPGLQRKILNLYSSLEHVFFMTTHSNHLLDITMDITSTSIFTFRKVLEPDDTADEHIPHFLVEAVDSGDHSSLELLGVRNSSVFLVNATIWVEGITDRWYLRALLNAYIKETSSARRLEEDVHYAFVEYGGSNITHWSFLDYEEHPITVERLCARALVIADQDGHTKVTRQQHLAEKLGTRFISLPCREIENLLSYDVIKQVVLEYERTPDRSLPQVAYDDYKDEYLGTFIEERLLEGNFARKNGYRAGSGTLKDKVGFCQRALTKIRYTDAPKSTQSVVTDLYNFICKQNT